ncbi:MAG TPA: hypothetical protein VN944_01005 [Nitrospiria bacterium]|nr:hypothetical protein [Nitrospiria bacterium]
MSTMISELVLRITQLEQELEREFEREIKEKHLQFRYRIEKGKVAFEREIRVLHKKLRQGVLSFLWESSLASLLVAPVIYSLVVPLILLDAWLWLFQAVCFPAYGIPKVDRRRYVVLDRGKLGYLNAIERFNCNFCGYANGLVAYGREVASRTEAYFCPIKHARPVSGTHTRYREFLDFGDSDHYKTKVEKIRKKLCP